jgi:hypothetical protein
VIIVLCIINVHTFVDFLFSFFLFLMDFGNALLSGTAVTAIDIIQIINNVSANIQAESYVPLNLVYGLSWFSLMFGVVLMGVIYIITIGEAAFYLFVIYPFLCRAGVMGLLLPATRSWFGTITSLALEQLLKPLLGKVFFWLTLILLQTGVNQIDTASSGIEHLLTQIAWLLFVITLGIVLQFRAPKISRLVAVGLGGAAGSITGSGLASSLLRVAQIGVSASLKPIGSVVGKAAGSTLKVTGANLAKTQVVQQGGRAIQAVGLAAKQEVFRPVGQATLSTFDFLTGFLTVPFRAVAESTEGFNREREIARSTEIPRSSR